MDNVVLLVLVGLLAVGFLSLTIAHLAGAKDKRAVIEASRDLMAENTKMLAQARRSMTEAAKFCLVAMETNNTKLFSLTERAHTAGILSRDGVLPYVRSSSERVNADIEAMARRLKVSPDQAIKYIQQQIEASD